MAEQVVTHHSMRAQVARCLFCGTVGNGWWDCSCEWGQKIREGKLPRPKTVMRNGIPIIECCAELRAAARLAGVIRMDATIPTPVTILSSATILETPNSDETPNDATIDPDATILSSGIATIPDDGESIVTERNCSHCGVGFVPRRPKAVYCSEICRIRAHRAKEKEE